MCWLDEQSLANLGVGEAIAGKSRNLSLLIGELVTRLNAPFAYAFTGGQQLALGACSERFDSHIGKHLECGTQLAARVEAAVLAAEPFAVKQVGAGQIEAHASACQSID